MKIKSALIALSSVALLSGCVGNQIKVNPDKEKYVVGIAQFVSHPALDAATKGFKEKLTALLLEEGREVEFDVQNANKELSLCATIASTLVSRDVDLILGNATPCLSAAYNATTYIPVLGTSVTDYGVALGVEMKDGKSGTNVSGTSDLAPIDVQIQEMMRLAVNAKKVGILYCSSEANSKFQVEEAKKYLANYAGVTVKEFAFSQASELQTVCNSALDQDIIYIPTDNACAEKAEAINDIFYPNRIPVYAGEEGICKGCGFATLSIDYERLGQITGEMAFNVLLGKKDIREYEVAYDTNPQKKYMSDRCAYYGIELPEDYTPIAL